MEGLLGKLGNYGITASEYNSLEQIQSEDSARSGEAIEIACQRFGLIRHYPETPDGQQVPPAPEDREYFIDWYTRVSSGVIEAGNNTS